MWQRTAKDRLARTLKALNEQCRLMRPWPLAEQHRRLCQILKGHFAYFGNSRMGGTASLDTWLPSDKLVRLLEQLY